MCVIRRIQTFFDDIDEWGLPDGSSFFVQKSIFAVEAVCLDGDASSAGDVNSRGQLN